MDMETYEIRLENVMNNFSYRDKFITECNAPIMGEKIYLTKLRYYSDGGVQKFW